MLKQNTDQVIPQWNGNTKLTFLNDHVEDFFTDTEYLQKTFDALLTGPDPGPRVLNIHAPYLMGKSALLTMLYRSCRSKGHYVALADACHAKTPQDILRELADQLEAEGISLMSYRKVLKIILEDSIKAPQPWESKVAEAPNLAKRAGTIAESVKSLNKPWMIELGLGVIDGLMWWRKKRKDRAAEEENRFKQHIKDQEAT